MAAIVLDTQSIVQLIIAAVAIYGAALSTYNLYSRRPKVKVNWSHGFLGTPGVGITSPPFLTLTAMNKGERTVMLGFVGFDLPYKNLFHILFRRREKYILQFPLPDKLGHKLPYELIPGTSFDYSTPFGDLARSLLNSGYSGDVKVSGYFKDQVGNIYRTKKFVFNIDEWLPKTI
jgi:hypothetical protein